MWATIVLAALVASMHVARVLAWADDAWAGNNCTVPAPLGAGLDDTDQVRIVIALVLVLQDATGFHRSRLQLRAVGTMERRRSTTACTTSRGASLLLFRRCWQVVLNVVVQEDDVGLGRSQS